MRNNLERQFLNKKIDQFPIFKAMMKNKKEIRINIPQSKSFRVINLHNTSQTNNQIQHQIDIIMPLHVRQMQSTVILPQPQQFQSKWLTLNGQRTKLYEVIKRERRRIDSLELHQTIPNQRIIQMSRSFRLKNKNKSHQHPLVFATKYNNKESETIANTKNIEVGMSSLQSKDTYHNSYFPTLLNPKMTSLENKIQSNENIKNRSQLQSLVVINSRPKYTTKTNENSNNFHTSRKVKKNILNDKYKKGIHQSHYGTLHKLAKS